MNGGDLLALMPSAVLLALIRAFSVNVPRWDEWDLVPFVVSLRSGALTLGDIWAQHNEHRIASVKLVMAPLILATDFDVRAHMYAGFALQFVAFGFLWALIRSTVRRPALSASLAAATAVLMFSPAQTETWLVGLTSLQWHLCHLTAAIAIWLLARTPAPRHVLALCWLLTCAALLALASGIALWGVVLLALVARSDGRDRRKPLVHWLIGTVALLAVFFVGWHGGPADPWSFVTRPLRFGDFVLIELGWPLAQGDTSFALVAARVLGLSGLAAAAVTAIVAHRRSKAAVVLPWFWLSAYSLLVVLITAVGRVGAGSTAATTNRYASTAALFWVGLLVAGAVAVGPHLADARTAARRFTKVALAAIVVAWALNSARLYRDGYRAFVQTFEDRRVALAELSAQESAAGNALALLYPPSASRIREYAGLLKSLRLGPFSSRMAEQQPRLDTLAEASRAGATEGTLEAAECLVVNGWAWEPGAPGLAITVDIYDGDRRLATVPAYWFRWDLADAGIGTGRHAYFYMPPADLKDGRTHMIRARRSGSGVELAGSPKAFGCSDQDSVLWR
jgi:hypothetical protein